MKNFLVLISLLASIGIDAQTLSNNLKGSYTSNNKTTMFNSFHFDGQGKVKVNENEDEYIFYEKNDSIYVIVDKTSFSFAKKSKGELLGTSDWVKDVKYKSKSKSFDYAPINPNQEKYLKLLDQYYELNFKEAFNLIFSSQPDNRLQLIENIQKKNQAICAKDFDLACVQEFAYRLTNMVGGLDRILNESSAEVKDDPGLLDLGKKIIRLGNPNGYGLIASYYLVLGNEEESDKYLNQGLEMGCKMCLEIEMNKLFKELEEEIEN
ncbi:hypothetical protein [Faecalibacter sp. LW9]|uniref:hypothetical protein n=1 Tax=Faecalibacter sp. LW9 TaxID=3103144 RepID=UPI002AFE2024|nr:hypothetical protein [Faecalibacter sp. LW9]